MLLNYLKTVIATKLQERKLMIYKVKNKMTWLIKLGFLKFSKELKNCYCHKLYFSQGKALGRNAWRFFFLPKQILEILPISPTAKNEIH